MTDRTAAMPRQSENPLDIFVTGAKKGFQISINSLLPNILMAYVIADMLSRLGLMKLIGEYGGPLMTVFGLPGIAITVLLTTWLSSSAAIGLTASLVSQGALAPEHVTIMMPAYFLLNAQLQYMGRLLGTAGVPKKYWPLLMVASLINAVCAMLIMHWFVV